MGLKLGHRLSAFRDALGQVEDRAAFVAREMVCVPLRPVVALQARRRGTSAAAEWQRIGSRAGYLRRHHLKGIGPAWVRHGTADVFTIAEVVGRDHEYGIPAEAREHLPRQRPPRIVDLGANIGMFSLRALRDLTPAHITAVEADPWNARILRGNTTGLHPEASWTIIEAFAAPAGDDVVAFASGNFTESRVGETATSQVPTVDAFALMEDADLVKVDIEGAEWPLLHDERLATHGSPVMVLEYHRWGCPDGVDPGVHAEHLLRAAGYEVHRHAPDAADFGTLWAWRRQA